MSFPLNPMKGCLGRGPNRHEKQWFHLPAAPNFNICCRCFVDHLSRTPFAGYFQMGYGGYDKNYICYFDRPRTHQVLAEALRGNDFGPLQNWIMRRSSIPDCKGAGVVTPEDNFDWYPAIGTPIESFGVCGACYEELVVGRGWASYFVNRPIKQTAPAFTCDTGFMVGNRASLNAQDFHEFQTTIMASGQTEDCPLLTDVEPASRNWWKFKPQDLNHYWVCEKCYYEWCSVSALAPHLQFVGKPSLRPGELLGCSVGKLLPLKISCARGIHKKSFDVFYRAAQQMTRAPPCTTAGMGPEGRWMTLNPPCAEFNVCGGCFPVFIEAADFPNRYQVFQHAMIQEGERRICTFNPAFPSAQVIFELMDQALDTGDARKFIEPVREIVTAPPCPRAEPQRSLVWYLNDKYACCPRCWVGLVRGTSLDMRAFPTRRNENVGWGMPLKCDFWSPRVRGLWKEALEKNDLTEFDQFMNHRLQVFGQTWPEANRLRGQLREGNMQQANMYQNAFIMSIGSSVAGAAGTNSSYGNSSIGWHPTAAGAEAAQLFNDASRIGGGDDDGEMLARIAELDARWKEVE